MEASSTAIQLGSDIKHGNISNSTHRATPHRPIRATHRKPPAPGQPVPAWGSWPGGCGWPVAGGLHRLAWGGWLAVCGADGPVGCGAMGTVRYITMLDVASQLYSCRASFHSLIESGR